MRITSISRPCTMCVCLLINEKCYQASIIVRWCVRILCFSGKGETKSEWESAENFYSMVFGQRRCDDDEKEKYFSRKTKQLNFLIYIIRAWEIGRLWGGKRLKRDECGIMLCQHYVVRVKNLFQPFPMRQFDIASADFISLSLAKAKAKFK